MHLFQETDLLIRRATADDIPLIRSLANVTFRDTYREILSSEQLEYMMDWMYSEASLQRQMGKDGHVYFLAEIQGRPCGYVSVQPRGLQEDGGFLFELQKIYVLPDCHGKQIGRRMYDHICDFVRQAANGWPCRIELHVNRYNAAVTFYKHLGMEILREGDFPIGHGYYMNDYIMGISL